MENGSEAFAVHLADLRRSYWRANPHQRWQVARQRIETTESGPNMLIACVSAIEGMLRSLVLWEETGGSRPTQATYDKYRHWKVEELYAKYLESRGCAGLIPEATRGLVDIAVEYRNLLAHECTYLGQSRYPELINACNELLSALCEHAGISNNR